MAEKTLFIPVSGSSHFYLFSEEACVIIEKILAKRKDTSSGPKIAIVDENNDPGKRTHGSLYIIGATVLSEDEVEEFKDITEKRFKNEEFKFRKSSPKLKHIILEEASELQLSVYVVTIRKPMLLKWTTGEKKNVHLNGVDKLIRSIIKTEKATMLHIILDDTGMVSKGSIEFILTKVSVETGQIITYEILDSRSCFMIQTNDYVIGSVGRKFNRKDDQYFNALHAKVYRKRLLFKKTKSLLKK